MKLPILEFERQIVECVAANPVTIIQAETGAGKSTQVPQILYMEGYSKITVTQPRVMAAISLATRVAEEFGEEVGKNVGYKTRFYKTEATTPITYVTDGYLLSTFSDQSCESEVVILDEIHEFNLNQETLLGLYKKAIAENKNLKLVIMSATIDAQKLSEFFDGAPVIEVPGKLYPVKQAFEPIMSMKSCVLKYFKQGSNMLVFLPGKEEIADLYSEIKAYFARNAELEIPHIFQLHGELHYEEQKKVFAHYDNGKIIFSTNVAQTSITVPDIDIVIDSGTCKQMVFSNGTSKLEVTNISQADCMQRAGRAGRCKSGEYVLCSETELLSRREFAIPEIRRISLENLVLKLATMGIDPTHLEFLHNPNKENLKNAKKLLEDLGALQDGSITEIGLAMEKMPVSARNARMLWEARKYSKEIQGDIAIIAAIIESGDMRGKDFWLYNEASDECQKSDLTYQLYLVKQANSLWHSLAYQERKDFYKKVGIKGKVYQNTLKTSKDIADKLKLKYMLSHETQDSNYSSIRKCIISAYCDSFYSFADSWRGIKYRGSDEIIRKLDRNSVFSNIWMSTPQIIIAEPLDIDIKRRYEEYTVNILKNATAIDMEDEEVRQKALAAAKREYYYDRYEEAVYCKWLIGACVIETQRTNIEPVFEEYWSRFMREWRYRVMVNGKEVGDIPA